MPPPKILFICLGNICRSPLAHATFTHLSANAYPTDSAGTGAYHTSAPPDARTLAVLKNNGITGFKHAARKIELLDFVEFDYILGMDGMNVGDLREMRGEAVRLVKDSGEGKSGRRRSREVEEFREAYARAEEDGTLAARRSNPRKGGSREEDGLAQVYLYGTFGGKDDGEEVADPYYGGNKGFEVAYEQCMRFGKGFLEFLEPAKD